MSIFLMGKQAFVDIGDNYMLCIGSKEEVDEATPQRLVEMIHEAMMWSKFRAIDSGRKRTLH